MSITACSQAEEQTKGPFTTNDENEYANAVTVEIDSVILEACYEYTELLGYEIKDKSKYRSVLLGQDNIKYVSLIDDNRRDMLDENDYLVEFDSSKIVIDADSGIALGNIPYV